MSAPANSLLYLSGTGDPSVADNWFTDAANQVAAERTPQNGDSVSCQCDVIGPFLPTFNDDGISLTLGDFSDGGYSADSDPLMNNRLTAGLVITGVLRLLTSSAWNGDASAATAVLIFPHRPLGFANYGVLPNGYIASGQNAPFYNLGIMGDDCTLSYGAVNGDPHSLRTGVMGARARLTDVGTQSTGASLIGANSVVADGADSAGLIQDGAVFDGGTNSGIALGSTRYRNGGAQTALGDSSCGTAIIEATAAGTQKGTFGNTNIARDVLFQNAVFQTDAKIRLLTASASAAIEVASCVGTPKILPLYQEKTNGGFGF